MPPSEGGGNIAYMTPEHPDAPHAAGPSSSPPQPQAGATPLYEHDCDRCVFLGIERKADLYFCDQRGLFPTVIARFEDASTGSGSYLSGIPLAKMAGGPAELAEALRRARAAGLVPSADATAQGCTAGSGGAST